LYFDVKFTLAGGQEVYRSYHIYMDWAEEQAKLKDTLAALYASEDYKTGCYPILNENLDPKLLNGITLYDNDNLPKSQKLNHSQMTEFLEVFRKDLLNTTLESSATERVMGSLCFTDSDDIYGRNGEYPIYENYTGTIELLNRYGIQGFSILAVEILTQIEVVPENNYAANGILKPEMVTVEPSRSTYTDDGQVFTDPEKMEAILSCVSYHEGNSSFYCLYSKEPTYRVYALRKNEYEELEVLGRYYMMADDAPEFFKNTIIQ